MPHSYTRTRSTSPTSPADIKRELTPLPQEKISAYYSLVFPHFTFYIQTLSITIGRRCAPNASAASSSNTEHHPVDVDLGALKSVSRLHAKIEYDQDEDRFVLVVIGRNGAWVDGVWTPSGSRAPLGERSQIQIASRTFHFVLPPPPAPEDTPSPSSQSSNNRLRSPSLDITSISPPSSQPSHTPPPVERKLVSPSPDPHLEDQQPRSPPRPPPEAISQPRLPNSNSIGKLSKSVSSKKRKKGDVDSILLPRPKPEDMPPKPPFTYAQLIYRAIKAIGEKATLQEICTWIMNTYDYYKYADGAWMSSVRHNLSSSRAFLKLERCGGDRGKGFFWKLDDNHCQALEEQEAKLLSNSPGGKDGQAKGRKRDKGIPLDPPLKRSIKGEPKGTPLPPPLTSTPLPFKTNATLNATQPINLPSASSVIGTTTTTSSATTGVFAYPAQPQQSQTAVVRYGSQPSHGSNPYAAVAQSSWGRQDSQPSSRNVSLMANNTDTGASSVPAVQSSAVLATTTVGSVPERTNVQTSAPSNVVPDVVIPIVLGPIPRTHPDYSPTHRNNSAKEGYMVLHERTLILDPDVFSGLTKDMLAELEKMGTRAALAILTGHMVKALKERRAKERGKARDKGQKKAKAKKGANANTPAFTNVPLERKAAQGTESQVSGPRPEVRPVIVSQGPPSTAPAAIPTLVPIAVPDSSPPDDPGSPIVVIDDSDDEGPVSKRRKVEQSLPA